MAIIFYEDVNEKSTVQDNNSAAETSMVEARLIQRILASSRKFNILNLKRRKILKINSADTQDKLAMKEKVAS
jgi:hypothetical protein